ncbi:hypothetical protein B0A94_25890 [Pseudomonas syringae]|nr:hypothetical protein B0A94_25890 [Pseudomonas syringae]
MQGASSRQRSGLASAAGQSAADAGRLGPAGGRRSGPGTATDRLAAPRGVGPVPRADAAGGRSIRGGR